MIFKGKSQVLSDLARRPESKTFFTGKPCAHGHVAERYTSSRQCVTCTYELAKARRLRNPGKATEQRRNWARRNLERSRAIKAAWNKANPEGQAKRSRKWFLENREKANAATEAWRLQNPAKAAARASRRRAAKMQRTPKWADHAAIELVYIEAQRRREAGEMVEVDHIIPLQGELVSGLHVPENLQIISMQANRSKANNFLEI